MTAKQAMTKLRALERELKALRRGNPAPRYATRVTRKHLGVPMTETREFDSLAHARSVRRKAKKTGASEATIYDRKAHRRLNTSYGGGVSVQYLPVNQKYAVLWSGQVLKKFSTRAEADAYARWLGAKGKMGFEQFEHEDGAFSRSLKGGKRRKNPTLLIASNPGGEPKLNPAVLRDPAYRAACKMYKKFHGSGHHQIVQINDAPPGTPKFLVALGRAPEVTYAPPKHSPKGKGPPFMHEWEHKPYLATDAKGRYLGYVGMGKDYKIVRSGIHG